ncbi:MAG: hypothetical protein M0T74_15635 [Desulfitobacterium hafniense]|nr:hypothetical protein [Desulfitobacterium hafniense]
MNKKRIYLIILALLLTLSWVGNLTYFYSQRLAEPVFLKNYIESTLFPNQNLEIELYYIVNRDETPDLVSVELPNLEKVYVRLRTFTFNTYSHYVLKRAIISIDRPQVDDFLGLDKISISQLRVHFSNGMTKVVDVGEINYKPLRSPNQLVFKNTASGSSNNHSGFREFLVDQPIVIKSVDYSHKELLGDALRVYLSISQTPSEHARDRNDLNPDTREKSKDIFDENQLVNRTKFPIQVQSGSYLRISYQFNQFNDRRSYDYYKIKAHIITQTSEGQEADQEFEIWYQPFFEEKDIKQVIRERREE